MIGGSARALTLADPAIRVATENLQETYAIPTPPAGG